MGRKSYCSISACIFGAPFLTGVGRRLLNVDRPTRRFKFSFGQRGKSEDPCVAYIIGSLFHAWVHQACRDLSGFRPV